MRVYKVLWWIKAEGECIRCTLWYINAEAPFNIE